jgi:peptidyl-prolyl cis-trans isomerase B (cyclophilin B)
MPPAWRIAFGLVRPLTLIASLLLALAVVTGCGGDEDGDEAPEGGEPAAEADPACESAEAPEPREVNLDPPPKKPSADDLVAVVETSCGVFEITLDTARSPRTAASFEYLAENGVFDGTPFHRILPGFIVQAGDPAGTGSGPGPGYTVDEPPPADTEYTQGVVAMAKSPVEPPGRSGSQFFVVTAADAGLPPDFAIAGEVTKGLDVVAAIETLGDPASGDTGEPIETVVVDSVTIEKG